jgi:hypothetical protein
VTFDRAKNWRMPFGEHKGRTLDDIAKDDNGLRYLDRLAGWEKLQDPLRDALLSYLADPAIQAELEKLGLTGLDPALDDEGAYPG